MDFKSKETYSNPYANANPISKLLFFWIIPLFRRGASKALELEDLYDPLKEDLSAGLGDTLERNWNDHIQKSRQKEKLPSFLLTLISTFGSRYTLIWIPLTITECFFRVSQSYCLRELVRSFSDEEAKASDQYLLAAGVTISTFVTTLGFHPTLYAIFRIAMQCRVSCSSLIYRKALKLSKAAQGKSTVGQLVNILSNDVNRFDFNMMFVPYIVAGPLQLAIFTYMLWLDFGCSTFAGVGVVIFLTPIQYWNGKMSTRFRRQIAARTDERGRVMNEIIIAMRVIKMYAWENTFAQVIDKIRRLEVKVLRKRAYLRGLYLSVYSSASKLVPFLTLLAFVLTDNDLTADKVFFLVSAHNTIIQSMTYMIPSAASGIGEILVSVKRIEDFLLLEEKENSPNLNITPALNGNASVNLESTTASWTGEEPHLTAINLTVSGNKVVVIVGPVGSGKTTFLHCLLNELKILSGQCTVQGSVSYASQESFVFAGNVRQNIVFGLPFDERKYLRVVKAAALEDDFNQLPYADLTIVGERGVSLSGGQKARVNLARCLYQEADIYLLDDPLSAVDTVVSRHLFQKCIKEHLDGHLRILVTHQLQYLPQADHIVVLNEGKIAAQGTYMELVEEGIDFVSLMASDAEDGSNRKESVVRHDNETTPKSKREKGPAAQTEAMAEGSISLQLYWNYFKTAKSNSSFFLLTISFFLTQFVITGTEWWLSVWTTAEGKKNEGNEDGYLGETNYLYVYAGLIIAVLIGNLLRAFGFFKYCMKISVNMQNLMFLSLIRAPSKFFDDNPSGRIMNRFTKDLGSMDEMLPPTFFDMLIIFFQIGGVIILVIVSNYYMVIPAIIILIGLWLIRRYYIMTARSIKRIEGITKSPVFTHSAATFQGLTTIRAAKAEGKLTTQFDAYQDIHSAAWFLFFSCSRCFGIWVEVVSIIFLAIVTFGFLLLQNSQTSGSVGLAVSSAMSLAGWFQYGMRQSAETENLMTSVERTLEYASIEPEAELESKPDKKPPSNWPKYGEILFQNVFLAYGEKNVIKNLSFDIKAKEKVGIIGRTGAGKSSIIQALFRMTEPHGQIFIDGVRINEIGLHDLRKAISIIPQDPVLFSGTMRYNLDPFSKYKDEDLWKALEGVELKDAVPSLDCPVADGGSNFSVGQRQLVCLARAILRQNKIIVMDEATANVDPRTDNFIQTTIRSKFSECSIITIAHRLNSVIDCDRILVLDNGYLKEYGHPHVLMQNPDGILTYMVNHTGKSSALLLRKMASETYHGKRGSFQTESLSELQSIANDNEIHTNSNSESE